MGELQSYLVFDINDRCILVLSRGDISQWRGDAIVVPANQSQSSSTELGPYHEAINKAAGQQLEHEAGTGHPQSGASGVKKLVTEARVTKGFKLGANYVIHAPCAHYQSDDVSAPLLAAAYKCSLDVANQRGFQTVAFPSIGTGGRFYPIALAAKVAMSVIQASSGNVQEVHLVLNEHNTFEEYAKAAKALFSTSSKGLSTFCGHSDAPTQNDAVGVACIAKGAASFLMDPGTPAMTLAVYGPWGSGKSSAMQLMESSMRDVLLGQVKEEYPHMKYPKQCRKAKDRLVVVWFNAWEFLSCQQVWGGLMIEILKSVEEHVGFLGRLQLLLWFNITQRWSKLLVDFITPVAAIALVIALFAIYGRQILGAYGDTQFAVDATAPVAAIVAFTVFVRQFVLNIKPMSQDAREILQSLNTTTEYKSQLGYQSQVKQHIRFLKNYICGQETPIQNTADKHSGKHFNSWLNTSSGTTRSKRRVVVFIDDLDRCQPDKVVEVLEAISLVLCADSGFTVVIGMKSEIHRLSIQSRPHQLQDKPVVQAAIEKFYGFKEDMSELFLQKIVQVEVGLVKPSGESMHKFLSSLLAVQPGGSSVDDEVPIKAEETSAKQSTHHNKQEHWYIPAIQPSVQPSGRQLPSASVGPETATETATKKMQRMRAGGDVRGLHHLLQTSTKYTAIERNALHEVLQRLVILTQTPPELRDIKRLINHHRLARNILLAQGASMAMRYAEKELVYWVALWWRFPLAMAALMQVVNHHELSAARSHSFANLSSYCTEAAACYSAALQETSNEENKKQLLLVLEQLKQLGQQTELLDALQPANLQTFSSIQLGLQYTRGSFSVSLKQQSKPNNDQGHVTIVVADGH